DSLALKRLIRQVRAVKFANKETGPVFTAPGESQPLDASSESEAGPASAAKPAATASVAADPSASVPSKTQKTLEMLQQNPGQVRDPLDMAELLFLSGRPAEAAPFYAKALDQINKVDPSYDADRAWILFQLGNCLRETDSARAQDAYMKLVSEYPNSPWTELAKAHGRLLPWYQKSRSGQVAAAAPKL
ncbi:MAG: tetratricopeptide repeat protein, partial [Phycisphaerales bacterium]